ncbi:MAG: FtsX-like permease family protein [Saprospiraceae bacterium]
MLYNYLKVALRNIFREKLYAIINVFGLAIGLGVCLLILLFVKDELSYDKYHSKADQIYRVVTEWRHGTDRAIETPINSYRLAPALAVDFPEIAEIVRFSPFGGLITYENQDFQEDHLFLVDDNVFDVFDFGWKSGNKATALKEPFTAVLSETTARKYFGEENPIGKVVKWNGENELRVTGIFQDFAPNNHLLVDIFVSMETGKQVFNQLVLNNWGEGSQYTYLLLPPEVSATSVAARFPDFIEKNMGEGSSKGVVMYLQPLTSIHLYSNLAGEIGANGNIRYIYISVAIALFIILIACINYMNLSTARSIKRAKEIGVRKTLGAARSSLILQFLSESVMIGLIAFLLAIGLVLMVLPAFNAFVDKSLTINPFKIPQTYLAFLGITVGIGLLAGSYPALYLSAFDVVKIFREKIKKGTVSAQLRKVLVVFQFCISTALIIGTLIIYNQWVFLRNKDLGYNKDNLILVPIPDRTQYETLKTQLAQNPNIVGITASNKMLTNRLSSNLGFKAENYEQDPQSPSSIKILTVDADFMKTLEIDFASGRDFSAAFGSDDTEAFILNEAAVKMIGWTDDPIGKWFETSEFDNGSWAKRTGKIIGVVEDFNMESLHNKIQPVVYYISKSWLNWMTLRINNHDTPATIDFIKDKWTQYGSEQAFDFTFMDDRINDLYQGEERYFRLFIAFTILAIFIASLGIFGLSSFTAEQRRKEIGIRKVFGASVGSLVMLLSKEFSWLVVIGFAFAVPIAYYMMDIWLADFIYRIDIGVGPFILAGLLALVIAWLTASFQSTRAAIENPIKSLRYE